MPDETRGPRRWRAIVAVVVLFVGLVVVFNFQAILLVGAILLAEKRPALLRDAEWNAPSSAVRFSRRFAPGTGENALLEWLSDEQFHVAQDHQQAERLTASLPCNERIVVVWRADGNGMLQSAQATVNETGCL